MIIKKCIVFKPTRRRRDNNQQNRRREGARAPQDDGARSADLRALRLARQGYGVVFSESGNAFARVNIYFLNFFLSHLQLDN